MKKFFYLFCTVLFLSQSSIASPGDTTWVQANDNQMTYYNNYDTTITFPAPGTTYRKIYMIFTMGKYMCPAGSTYCGDWDYTVLNYLMTPGGDTLELSRLITPYANAGAPRTPWAWQQHYVFDVTNYAPLLHGSATIRTLFSGYSGGFTENIKFAFIEGTPDRNVLSVKRLWTGSYSYGGTPDINTHFPAVSETAAAGATSTALKFTVTGHGADNAGCCEFMSHDYQVILNSTSVATKTMWRSDCGSAELYPQSGTWLFERGNWCPGALVYPNWHTLPGITGGTSYNVALQFDAYTSSGGSLGSYTTEAQVFDYGAMNKTLDASLDQIIAPTSDENHFRENPISMSPIVHVKNTGTTAITGLMIACTVDGGAVFNYNWTGSLSTFQETDITIPGMPDIKSVSGTSGTHNFVARITMVNGSTGDDDTTNNTMYSSFIGAPQWPVSFKVQMRTNNETAVSGLSETEWKIYDESNTVVASRTGANINTQYIDTLTLIPGSYRLVITDGSCDGLQWWYHGAASDGVNAGFFYVKQVTGANITMNGYNYGGTYNNDFGCGFTQYFTTAYPVGVNDLSANQLALDAYPNPAQNTVSVDISGMQQVNGKIQIIDVLGRVVSETVCNDSHIQVNTESLKNGVYTLLFTDSKQSNNRLTTRLIIAK